MLPALPLTARLQHDAIGAALSVWLSSFGSYTNDADGTPTSIYKHRGSGAEMTGVGPLKEAEAKRGSATWGERRFKDEAGGETREHL